jgi:hypothetical protein
MLILIRSIAKHDVVGSWRPTSLKIIARIATVDALIRPNGRSLAATPFSLTKPASPDNRTAGHWKESSQVEVMLTVAVCSPLVWSCCGAQGVARVETPTPRFVVQNP